MMKKGMGTLVCLALMAAVWSWAATSWQVQTKLSNTGGTLQVRNKAVQTVVGTTVFNTFTTSAPVPVTVTASQGYKISSLTRNGSAVLIGNYTSHFLTSFQLSGGTSQSLIAGFTASQISVYGQAGSGGSISPALTTTTVGGSATFTITPTTSTTLVSSVSPSTATLTNLSGSPVTLPYPGTVKATVSNLTASTTVTAGFTLTSANAGPVKYSIPGTPVTLEGSASGTSSSVFLWSKVSGPSAATLSSLNVLNPTFTPDAIGSYVFQLTVYQGSTPLASSQTQVSVSSSLVTAQAGECIQCHLGSTQAEVNLAFSAWSSSTHKMKSVSCTNCHGYVMPNPITSKNISPTNFVINNSAAGNVGDTFCLKCHNPSIVTDFAASKHSVNAMVCTSCHVNGVHNPTPAVSICNSCHADAQGNVAAHPFAIAPGQVCITCHNPHSSVGQLSTSSTDAHFNNLTSVGYPASYMASRSNCADCHYEDSATTNLNANNRHLWAQSGHGTVTAPGWTALDFKTKSGCVQCHSTTGFVAFSTAKITAAWGVASDKTKEVLTCRGCHSDITTGAVRKVTPSRPYTNDSYQNRDIGTSTICLNCHAGPTNGNSIQVKVDVADFTNTPFLAPHFMQAGGNLHGKSGYHFPGQVYDFYSSNSHRTIGMGNTANTGTAGPCVACHMSTANKHLYRAVTTDNNGVITGINSTACVNCHSTYLDAAKLVTNKADFVNALNVLNAMLAEKGFNYLEISPYFNNTNWGSGQTGANNMGAAYNYMLLLSEPGIYAHNSAYAKKLITDSIDCLYNGAVTGDIDMALAYLVSRGDISQEVANSMTSYKSKDSCTSCHGGTAATSGTMSSNAHGAHLTSGYGPGYYFGTDVNSCEACHVYGQATHRNGVVNLVAAPCTGCHAGTTPAWNVNSRLDCTSCHAATPSVLPNGTAAPYKANFGSTGHGQYAPSNQCTNCHDANSRHITGTLGDDVRLLLANNNDLCASCHSDSTKVRDSYLNMKTHVSLNCRECHDPHGTSNVFMLRSAINGVSISVTDLVNGLVDSATNRGLCQVCHTLTRHYRAGVPETKHYTSGCLGCHSHNGFGGAFVPAGGTCDACHGYPPAPTSTATVVRFGIMNNWSSARFEEYSGGGGAHLVAAHVSPLAKPSEGWLNCTVCHNAGRTTSAPYHQMVTPVASHVSSVHIEVDPKHRFAEGFTIYSGAKQLDAPARNQTGSCSNINCHMSMSPRWSIER